MLVPTSKQHQGEFVRGCCSMGLAGSGPWKFLHEGVDDWWAGLKRGDPSSVYFAAVEERKRSVSGEGEGGVGQKEKKSLLVWTV